VIWVVSIVTFLGTIVVFIFLFFLYSERERIRDALRKTGQRRLETRTSARVRLELSSLDEHSIHEIILTENVSHHGACAVTKTRWPPNNSALVRFLVEDVSVRARIAYCNPLGDTFAVGLQFSTAIDPWTVPYRVYS
jgi:PilZ domain